MAAVAAQPPEGTWARRFRVLQRPLMVLLLLSLNGALGTVDRNLHDAQTRHGSAGLHWWSWLVIVAAAFATAVVFAGCDDTDPDGDSADPDVRLRDWLWARVRRWLRPFSSVDERVKHFSDDFRDNTAFAFWWRVAIALGVVASLLRGGAYVLTWRNDDVPVAGSGFAALLVGLATVALLAIGTLRSIHRVRTGVTGTPATSSELSEPPPAGAPYAPPEQAAGGGVGDLAPAADPRRDRHRETVAVLSLVAAWGFAVLTLGAPYAANQIGDIMLSWTDELLPPAASFGIAGVLLFCLALQEGAMTMAIGGADARGRVRSRPRRRTYWPLRLVGALSTFGAVLLYVGTGYIDVWSWIALIPLLLVGFAEWAERRLGKEPVGQLPGRVGFTSIAVLPLQALTAVLVGATVDALFIIGPNLNYVLRALPPLALLVAAVVAIALSTDRMAPDRLTEEDLPAWIAGAAVVVVVSVVWLVGSPHLAGIVALAAVAGYAYVVRSTSRLWALNLSLCAGAALVVWTLGKPFVTGAGLSTLGVIGFASAALFAIAQYMVRLCDLVPLPKRVQGHQPFYRLPILSIAALWAAVALFAAPRTAHDVPMREADVRTPNGVSVTTALNQWWSQQPEATDPATGRAAADADKEVPLVLIAAEGGGLRAAYWTAGVLDVITEGPGGARRNLDAPDPAPGGNQTCDPPTAAKRLFLLSGASGGSIGAYAYQRERQLDHGCLPARWYNRWFARDLLGPTAGWELVHDLFATAFHQLPGDYHTCNPYVDVVCGVMKDRNQVFERALDRWPDATADTMRGADPDHPRLPLLVFNTAADTLEERVPLSTVTLPAREHATEPALQAPAGQTVCPDRDLAVRTAAVLSARFPIVTSAGRLLCAHRSVVDGGYLENTGLASIGELLPSLAGAVKNLNDQHGAIRPKVRIVIIEVSNNPEGAATPLRTAGVPSTPPSPKFAPMSVIQLPGYPTTIGRDELTEAVAAACPQVHIAVLTVRPDATPGWQASVGWRMSRAARDGLEHALADTDQPTRPAAAAQLLASAPGRACP